jgi:hypothetical protein
MTGLLQLNLDDVCSDKRNREDSFYRNIFEHSAAVYDMADRGDRLNRCGTGIRIKAAHVWQMRNRNMYGNSTCSNRHGIGIRIKQHMSGRCGTGRGGRADEYNDFRLYEKQRKFDSDIRG